MASFIRKASLSLLTRLSCTELETSWKEDSDVVSDTYDMHQSMGI